MKIRVPAFIIDPYGDVIALNPLILAFYQTSKEQLDKSELLSRYNMMRLLFSPEFSLHRSLMGKSWYSFAHQTIHIFRAMNLRYRTSPYFKKLVTEMSVEYPLFLSYWQGSPFIQRDQNHFMDNSRFSYQLFNINFEVISSTITSATPEGELLLYSFIPLTSEASWAFDKLLKIVGTGLIRLSLWPKNGYNMPE